MAPAQAYVPNLRQHRTLLSLTLEEVAAELGQLAWAHYGVHVGVNADMVGKWERGEKRPSKLYRQLLCLLYQCSAEELGCGNRAGQASCAALVAWLSPHQASAVAGQNVRCASAKPPSTTWRA